MIKVAVIGCGYFGRLHAQKYAKIPNAKLVGVCDIYLNKAKAVAKEVGCEWYIDHRALINKVNAVSVVTSTPYHYSVCKEMLRAGVDVLVEKPITQHVEAANILIDIAKKKKLILQVGHIERFNPSLPNLQWSGGFSFTRDTIDTGRGQDVHVVLDLMIHDLDIVLNTVPYKITKITAAGNYDKAIAGINFTETTYVGFYVNRKAKKAERFIEYKDKIIPLDNHDEDLLMRELKNFVDCVHTRLQPIVTGEAGRDALKVALDIIKEIN